MTDYISPDSSGTTYPPYDRKILSFDDWIKVFHILIAPSSLAPSTYKIKKSDTGSSSSYDQSYDDPNSYANPYDPGYSSPSVDSGKILYVMPQ